MKVGMCLIIFAIILIIPVIEFVATGRADGLWIYQSILIAAYVFCVIMLRPFNNKP